MFASVQLVVVDRKTELQQMSTGKFDRNNTLILLSANVNIGFHFSVIDNNDKGGNDAHKQGRKFTRQHIIRFRNCAQRCVCVC